MSGTYVSDHRELVKINVGSGSGGGHFEPEIELYNWNSLSIEFMKTLT